jgi:hypothetical protein
MKKVISTFACITFLVGCGSAQYSKVAGLANSASGSNIAVIMGSPNGLEGVPTDVREFNKAILDANNNFKFKTAIHDKAVTEDVLRLTRENSKDADTLLWFFSGHGGGGDFLTEDGSIFFGDIVNLILKTRNNKPLKRFMVFLDTCESGHVVDGTIPVIGEGSGGGGGNDDDNEDDDTKLVAQHNMNGHHSKCSAKTHASHDIFSIMAKGFENKLFEQGFVFASSLKTESSEDLGAEQGGAFTWHLREAMAKLRKSNPNATFGELADLTVKLVTEHHAIYRAYPTPAMLKEKIFTY